MGEAAAPLAPAPPSPEPPEAASEGERRLIDALEATALGCEKAGDAWHEKLECDVFDAAEADAALELWGHQWDAHGDILTKEIRAMKQGESLLPEPVYDAYFRAWQAFRFLEAQLREAQDLRSEGRAETQELRRKIDGEAAG